MIAEHREHGLQRQPQRVIPERAAAGHAAGEGGAHAGFPQRVGHRRRLKPFDHGRERQRERQRGKDQRTQREHRPLQRRCGASAAVRRALQPETTRCARPAAAARAT